MTPNDLLADFVRKLAEEKICDDEPHKCSHDSGPYCGTHPFDDWVNKEAREVLSSYEQLRKAKL